jgi:hypothetical protein
MPDYPKPEIGDVVLVEYGSECYEARILTIATGRTWSGNENQMYYKLRRMSFWSRPWAPRIEWLNETHIRDHA